MGILSGTPLAGLGVSNSFVNGIGMVLVFVVAAVFIVGIVWFVSRQKRFNTLAPIISDRQGATRFFLDWGVYSKDKKTNLWDFKLKDLKEKLMPPPDSCMLVGKGGRNVIMWYQSSAGEIYPCKLEIQKPIVMEEVATEVTGQDGKVSIVMQKVAKAYVKVIEPDIALWGALNDEKLMSVYGHTTWWDKYGNQVMFFGAAVLTLALIFMVLKKIDIVQEAARLFSEAAQTLKASSVQVASTAP